MEIEEAKYWLSILIEQDLYKRIKATKEGNFPDEEEMIKGCIESFTNTLPEWTIIIPDLRMFISNEIERCEMHDKEVEEIRKENEQQRKDREQQR